MLNRIDRLRLVALLLWTLPVAALLPLGLLWLWQSGNLPWWLAAMQRWGHAPPDAPHATAYGRIKLSKVADSHRDRLETKD